MTRRTPLLSASMQGILQHGTTLFLTRLEHKNTLQHALGGNTTYHALDGLRFAWFDDAGRRDPKADKREYDAGERDPVPLQPLSGCASDPR